MAVFSGSLEEIRKTNTSHKMGICDFGPYLVSSKNKSDEKEHISFERRNKIFS